MLREFDERGDPDKPERPFWWWVLIASFTGMLIVAALQGRW